MNNAALKHRRAAQEAERVAAVVKRRTAKAVTEPDTQQWTGLGVRVQQAKHKYLLARARLARLEQSVGMNAGQENLHEAARDVSHA